jgi:hypothetical protein
MWAKRSTDGSIGDAMNMTNDVARADLSATFLQRRWDLEAGERIVQVTAEDGGQPSHPITKHNKRTPKPLTMTTLVSCPVRS